MVGARTASRLTGNGLAEAQRRSADQVALNVEGVVDGGVCGEELPRVKSHLRHYFSLSSVGFQHLRWYKMVG